MGRTAKPDLTVAIIVLAALGAATLTMLVATVCVARAKRTAPPPMRMALRKRRWNATPRTFSVGDFSRILPGSISVERGDTFVRSSIDLRPFLQRGDPVKIGPQVFVVDTDERKLFTEDNVPLGREYVWADANGGSHATTGGVLIGPDVDSTTLFTCEFTEQPGNKWNGPTGGAIGFWDSKGNWRDGDCDGRCPQWYSPLWMGENGEQHGGPSHGLVRVCSARGSGKVQSATRTNHAVRERNEVTGNGAELLQTDLPPRHRQRIQMLQREKRDILQEEMTRQKHQRQQQQQQENGVVVPLPQMPIQRMAMQTPQPQQHQQHQPLLNSTPMQHYDQQPEYAPEQKTAADTAWDRMLTQRGRPQFA